MWPYDSDCELTLGSPGPVHDVPFPVVMHLRSVPGQMPPFGVMHKLTSYPHL
jgi:hypothetical protein